MDVWDLATEVDGKFSFAAAYEVCKGSHTHEPDYLKDAVEEASEDEFEEPSIVDEDEALQEWKLLAGRGPQNDANLLGERDLDRL